MSNSDDDDDDNDDDDDDDDEDDSGSGRGGGGDEAAEHTSDGGNEDGDEDSNEALEKALSLDLLKGGLSLGGASSDSSGSSGDDSSGTAAAFGGEGAAAAVEHLDSSVELEAPAELTGEVKHHAAQRGAVMLLGSRKLKYDAKGRAQAGDAMLLPPEAEPLSPPSSMSGGSGSEGDDDV